jgi:hypothetical protein
MVNGTVAFRWRRTTNAPSGANATNAATQHRRDTVFLSVSSSSPARWADNADWMDPMLERLESARTSPITPERLRAAVDQLDETIDDVEDYITNHLMLDAIFRDENGYPFVPFGGVSDTDTGAPPASAVALSLLTRVRVGNDDGNEQGMKTTGKKGVEEVVAVNVGEPCPICLEEYKCDQLAVCLPCGHSYHDSCAQSWLKLHGTCPLCRCSVSVGPSGGRDRSNAAIAIAVGGRSGGSVGRREVARPRSNWWAYGRGRQHESGNVGRRDDAQWPSELSHSSEAASAVAYGPGDPMAWCDAVAEQIINERQAHEDEEERERLDSSTARRGIQGGSVSLLLPASSSTSRRFQQHRYSNNVGEPGHDSSSMGPRPTDAVLSSRRRRMERTRSASLPSIQSRMSLADTLLENERFHRRRRVEEVSFGYVSSRVVRASASASAWLSGWW